MIPVRVSASLMPVLAAERRFTIAADHPLAAGFCPVCDGPLTGQPVVLVFVGIEPEDRKPAGFTTGAAVAVHAVCAGVSEDEPVTGASG